MNVCLFLAAFVTAFSVQAVSCFDILPVAPAQRFAPAPAFFSNVQGDAPVQTAARICPEGSVLYRREPTFKCIFPELVEKVTWFEANLTCRQLGGRLLQVNDFQKHRAVRNLLRDIDIKETFWFGLHNIYETNEEYSWTDGSIPPLELGELLRYEPMFLNIFRCGVLIPYRSGRWGTDICVSRKHFICEIDPTRLQSTFEDQETKEDLPEDPSLNEDREMATQILLLSTTPSAQSVESENVTIPDPEPTPIQLSTEVPTQPEENVTVSYPVEKYGLSTEMTMSESEENTTQHEHYEGEIMHFAPHFGELNHAHEHMSTEIPSVNETITEDTIEELLSTETPQVSNENTTLALEEILSTEDPSISNENITQETIQELLSTEMAPVSNDNTTQGSMEEFLSTDTSLVSKENDTQGDSIEMTTLSMTENLITRDANGHVKDDMTDVTIEQETPTSSPTTTKPFLRTLRPRTGTRSPISTPYNFENDYIIAQHPRKKVSQEEGS